MFDDQKKTTALRRPATPTMAGFRPGMTSSRLIAGELGALYNPPVEIPGEMRALLQAIDAKTCRGS